MAIGDAPDAKMGRDEDEETVKNMPDSELERWFNKGPGDGGNKHFWEVLNREREARREKKK